MKKFIILFSFIALLGCGTNNSPNQNGSLTIGAVTNQYYPLSSDAAMTVTYTNPTKTNLLGTQIDVYINGALFTTLNTNNSGVTIFTLTNIPRLDYTQYYQVVFRTGDLEAYTVVTVNAVAAPSLVVTAPTVTSGSGHVSSYDFPSLSFPINFVSDTLLGGTPQVYGTSLSVVGQLVQPGNGVKAVFTNTTSSTVNFNITILNNTGTATTTLPVNVTFSNLSSLSPATQVNSSIIWTVTDPANGTSGISGNGTTTISFTKQ